VGRTNARIPGWVLRRPSGTRRRSDCANEAGWHARATEVPRPDLDRPILQECHHDVGVEEVAHSNRSSLPGTGGWCLPSSRSGTSAKRSSSANQASTSVAIGSRRTPCPTWRTRTRQPELLRPAHRLAPAVGEQLGDPAFSHSTSSMIAISGVHQPRPPRRGSTSVVARSADAVSASGPVEHPSAIILASIRRRRGSARRSFSRPAACFDRMTSRKAMRSRTHAFHLDGDRPTGEIRVPRGASRLEGDVENDERPDIARDYGLPKVVPDIATDNSGARRIGASIDDHGLELAHSGVISGSAVPALHSPMFGRQSRPRRRAARPGRGRVGRRARTPLL
jgi:hypothetical protein